MAASGNCRPDDKSTARAMMAHDRLESDELPLTHEFLAMMLGVYRPGVTIALNLLVILSAGIFKSKTCQLSLSRAA
jgi:hypothetical protein